MPKIIEIETLRGVTYDLAALRGSIAEIAKRHGVGRQWVYDWRDKLIFHDLHGCRHLSDDILTALRDKRLRVNGFG